MDDAGKCKSAGVDKAALDVDLVVGYFESIVRTQAERFTTVFYGELFEKHPDLKSLFETVDPQRQHVKLMRTLILMVQSLNDEDATASLLSRLGHRHQGYGATPPMFNAVGNAFLVALGEMGGEAWDEALHEQWSLLLRRIVRHMLDGMGRADALADICFEQYHEPQAKAGCQVSFEGKTTSPDARPADDSRAGAAHGPDKSESKMPERDTEGHTDSAMASPPHSPLSRWMDKIPMSIPMSFSRRQASYCGDRAHGDVPFSGNRTISEVPCVDDSNAEATPGRGLLSMSDADELKSAAVDQAAIHVDLVVSYFESVVKTQAERFTTVFYGELFEKHPNLKSLFETVDPQRQHVKLMRALILMVQSLNDDNTAARLLSGLGHRHLGYGATPPMFNAFGNAFLVALGEMGGEAWDEALHEQWSLLLRRVVHHMLNGMGRADALADICFEPYHEPQAKAGCRVSFEGKTTSPDARPADDSRAGAAHGLDSFDNGSFAIDTPPLASSRRSSVAEMLSPVNSFFSKPRDPSYCSDPAATMRRIPTFFSVFKAFPSYRKLKHDDPPPQSPQTRSATAFNAVAPVFRRLTSSLDSLLGHIFRPVSALFYNTSDNIFLGTLAIVILFSLLYVDEETFLGKCLGKVDDVSTLLAVVMFIREAPDRQEQKHLALFQVCLVVTHASHETQRMLMPRLKTCASQRAREAWSHANPPPPQGMHQKRRDLRGGRGQAGGWRRCVEGCIGRAGGTPPPVW